MNIKLIFITFLLQGFINFKIQSEAAMAASASAQCALNELYYNSALSPVCDVNCQALEFRCPVSSVRPVAGCYCKVNYARNLQQQCIPQTECANDCFRNEIPLAPDLKGCENSCPQSPKDIYTKICYILAEKRCICKRDYCRNSRGQCVQNTI